MPSVSPLLCGTTSKPGVRWAGATGKCSSPGITNPSSKAPKPPRRSIRCRSTAPQVCPSFPSTSALSTPSGGGSGWPGCCRGASWCLMPIAARSAKKACCAARRSPGPKMKSTPFSSKCRAAVPCACRTAASCASVMPAPTAGLIPRSARSSSIRANSTKTPSPCRRSAPT